MMKEEWPEANLVGVLAGLKSHVGSVIAKNIFYLHINGRVKLITEVLRLYRSIEFGELEVWEIGGRKFMYGRRNEVNW